MKAVVGGQGRTDSATGWKTINPRGGIISDEDGEQPVQTVHGLARIFEGELQARVRTSKRSGLPDSSVVASIQPCSWHCCS